MQTYPPEPEEIQAWMDERGLSSRMMGRLLRFSDAQSSRVRYWRKGDRRMPFPVWFTLYTLVEGREPGPEQYPPIDGISQPET